jgi:hypothetical protein
MTEPLIIGAPRAKEPVMPVHAMRCGNCFWHVVAPERPGLITCQSGPPVPLLCGVTEDRLGRPVPQIINAWPQLPADQKACRFWNQQGPKPGARPQ